MSCWEVAPERTDNAQLATRGTGDPTAPHVGCALIGELTFPIRRRLALRIKGHSTGVWMGQVWGQSHPFCAPTGMILSLRLGRVARSQRTSVLSP